MITVWCDIALRPSASTLRRQTAAPRTRGRRLRIPFFYYYHHNYHSYYYLLILLSLTPKAIRVFAAGSPAKASPAPKVVVPVAQPYAPPPGARAMDERPMMDIANVWYHHM